MICLYHVPYQENRTVFTLCWVKWTSGLPVTELWWSWSGVRRGSFQGCCWRSRLPQLSIAQLDSRSGRLDNQSEEKFERGLEFEIGIGRCRLFFASGLQALARRDCVLSNVLALILFRRLTLAHLRCEAPGHADGATVPGWTSLSGAPASFSLAPVSTVFDNFRIALQFCVHGPASRPQIRVFVLSWSLYSTI